MAGFIRVAGGGNARPGPPLLLDRCRERPVRAPVLFEAVFLPDDVEGPAFDLLEYGADIAADNAEGEQLDTAQEEHGDDDRFEAGHIDPVDQIMQDSPDAIGQADARDHRA